jgi:hypothetical protein
MTTSTRCDLTDLLPDQCGCRHHRGGQTPAEQVARYIADDRARLLLTPGWFPAAFPGHCTRCGGPFKADAAIRRDPGLGWRAECCP